MADSAPDFEALLEQIKDSIGIDFTIYKRPSLRRRLEKRLQVVGAVDMAGYQEHLRAHPEELAPLLDVLLINVTSFFRDPASWQYLAEVAVPNLLAAKPPAEPVRLWSAGCASGREAYSLAVMFAEALGREAFRERVTIYATDLDESEIEYARRASYTEREMEAMPPNLREKYFERQGNRYACVKDVRRAVIFARHDLLQDAPISRIDLLCCRNTLMYFNSEGQAKAMSRLYYALSEGGLLFLGKAEMLAAYSSLFVPLDLKRRIFAKVPEVGARERQRFIMERHKTLRRSPLPVSKQTMMQNIVFEGGTLAQVLVDQAGTVAMVNEQARLLFGLTGQDIGRPLQDLELSYRPADLRSLMDEAHKEKRLVCVRDILWTGAPGEIPLILDITVVPLLDASQNPLGTTITFVDMTPQRQAQSELQTINGEVRVRSDELSEVNAFMESILRSFQAGVAVLNQELQVQVWNSKMEDMWGLRADEAQGNHFWNLDIGLPVERLKQPLRAILNGQDSEGVLLMEAHNRKGREIVCRITCMPLLGTNNVRRGMVLLMEEQPPANLPAAARQGSAEK